MTSPKKTLVMTLAALTLSGLAVAPASAANRLVSTRTPVATATAGHLVSSSVDTQLDGKRRFLWVF